MTNFIAMCRLSKILESLLPLTLSAEFGGHETAVDNQAVLRHASLDLCRVCDDIATESPGAGKSDLTAQLTCRGLTTQSTCG